MSLKLLVAFWVCFCLAACGGGEAPAGLKSADDASPHARIAASNAGVKKALATPDSSPFRANGWYWNPNESGTGFLFEAQGRRGFVAFFMYEEVTGKPVWYESTGDLTYNADGSIAFSGDLRYFTNGQALSAPVYRTPTFTIIGRVQMSFSGVFATVQFPGRNMSATRFDFAGLNSTPTMSQPETGWYWNPEEGGRGYGVEVQNNQLFMAIFHYNDDGSPTWHTVRGDIGSGTVTSPMQLYVDGQTLTSAYRQGGTLYEIGSLTMSFRNRCAGQIQRAGSSVVSVRRYVFGDMAPGAECHTVSGGTADVAGVQHGPVQMQPGDAIHGVIDTAEDVDAFGIALQADVSYRFELKGFDSGNGTLWDPMLELYDGQLLKVAENDDGSDYDYDSSMSFTPSASGTYYLAARAYQALTGSFVLTASGIAPGLVAQSVPAIASYAGVVDGTFTGKAQGAMVLTVDSQGIVTGTSSGGGQVQPLQITGTVASGGVVQLSADTSAGKMRFTGFAGPQGDLSGTWSDPGGAGGMFMGARRGSPIAPP